MSESVAGGIAAKTRADKRILRQEQAAYQSLRAEALSALDDYRRCVNNFDFICDEKLIDVSVYNIRSAACRYDFLLSNLKRISR